MKMSKNQIAATKLNNVRSILAKSIPQMEMALPKHLTGERLSRIALTEIRKNPKLLDCEPKSFVGAIMQCAQLGLEPGTELGQAYLIPFYNSKNKQEDCQFIIGYRGMISLARNSGQLQSINAQCVYDNEVFEFEYGINEKLKHIPTLGSKGEFLGAYAIAKLKDGGYQFLFVDKEKIYKLRDEQLAKIKNDYAKKYSPWSSCFEEMACKTAIRRLFKYLPISVEMQSAISADEAADRGEQNNKLFTEINTDIDVEQLDFDDETGEINETKINDAVSQLN
jgi:recombination protein RecT